MTYIRYDVLGAAGYQKLAIQNIPHGSVPAILVNCLNKQGRKEEFKGNALSFIKKIYKNNKFPAIFVHGLWRDNHDFKSSDFKRVRKTAVFLQKLCTGKPIYYCPFLEDKQSAAFKKDIYAKLAKVAPNLILVNNPMDGGDYVPGMINELHHTAKPRGQRPPLDQLIFSTDGVDAFDSNFESFKKQYGKCHMFAVWIPIFNRRKSLHDPTKRPDRRAKPSGRDFSRLKQMTADL